MVPAAQSPGQFIFRHSPPVRRKGTEVQGGNQMSDLSGPHPAPWGPISGTSVLPGIPDILAQGTEREEGVGTRGGRGGGRGCQFVSKALVARVSETPFMPLRTRRFGSHSHNLPSKRASVFSEATQSNCGLLNGNLSPLIAGASLRAVTKYHINGEG